MGNAVQPEDTGQGIGKRACVKTVSNKVRGTRWFGPPLRGGVQYSGEYVVVCIYGRNNGKSSVQRGYNAMVRWRRSGWMEEVGTELKVVCGGAWDEGDVDGFFF